MTRMRFAPALALVFACKSPAPPAPTAPTAPTGNHDAPATAALPPHPQLAAVLTAATAQRDAGDRAACVERLATIDAAWLGSTPQATAALALMQDCAGRDDPFCDYYLEGIVEGDGNEYCVLSLAVAFGPRLAYEDAAAMPCGFAAAEGAIAVPGDPTRCLAVEPGAGIELDDLPDDGDVPPGTCAQVLELTRDGASRPLAIDGGSFIEDPSTCCSAGPIRARRHGDAVEVILESGGPARDCFGGTASIDQLEVFRLDGARLTELADLGVGMH